MATLNVPASAPSAPAPAQSTAPTSAPVGTSGGAALFRALQTARKELTSAANGGRDTSGPSGTYNAARAAFLDHPADAREQVSFAQAATKKRPARTVTMPVRDAQARIRDNNPITLSGMFAAKVS